MSNKKILIIGAGPAGLTAAYEILEKTNDIPIIFEETGDIGGISKTVDYKGNKMDMGGHRFFSKSDKVMDWWINKLPLQGYPSKDDILLDKKKQFSTKAGSPDPEKIDQVMLIRERLSRIFFLRSFIDYPLTINFDTMKVLGVVRIFKILISYLKTKFSQIHPEKSLEDFMINRFGRELYSIFFKDYTQKVWGVSPREINPDWGIQRIKGLSITTVLLHALKKIFNEKEDGILQKGTETSLIEQFLYPKYGPGQLWEEVAKLITAKGGEIHLNSKVVQLNKAANQIISIEVEDTAAKSSKTVSGEYVISTMPVKDLIRYIRENKPDEINEIAEGLIYRDFITVGLLLKKLSVTNNTKIKTMNELIPDLWVYIQEKDVKIGRLQIFNNWSPYLLKDNGQVWLGLEYFCTEGDSLWNMKNDEFIHFAIDELIKLNIIQKEDVIDYTIVRVPKAYPAYFGTYQKFDQLKFYLDQIENLYLIGRNGMHRYNNMDHSMLSAFEAVNNIIHHIPTKDNIWQINSDAEYHEIKENSNG